jgi:L-lactate dehydrogenase complex protein LldG
MTSRDAILGTVRANKPPPQPLPDVPFFDSMPADQLIPSFWTAFAGMGGTRLEAEGIDPLDLVRERVEGAGIVVSLVPGINGNRKLDPTDPPQSCADVDVAVVRAAFGVAETGSVAFTERELVVNTLAYLAQHLVVLLDPADIEINLHRAYQRPEFKTARYCVLHSGPSATADIEGVLIRGAQGVRSLSVALVAR